MKTTILPMIFLLAIFLSACSPAVATPQVLPAAPPTEASPPPTVDTSSTQCGYQWAYQDIPDLTAQFDAMVQTLIPNSTSRATAYGENCIGNDGQIVRFLAMETDFYVLAAVETLDDYETFGDWIYDAMLVVDGIPPEDLAGPQPGFVEFRFEKSVSESLTFRVPIQGFFETAGDKSGEELFRLFYTSP